MMSFSKISGIVLFAASIILADEYPPCIENIPQLGDMAIGSRCCEKQGQGFSICRDRDLSKDSIRYRQYAAEIDLNDSMRIARVVKQKMIDSVWAVTDSTNKAEEKRAKLEKIKSKKWPKRTVKAVLEGKVFVGMNSEQALESWGEPDDINRTITARGTSEQWVFGSGSYLYFDNGILTTIQN